MKRTIIFLLVVAISIFSFCGLFEKTKKENSLISETTTASITTQKFQTKENKIYAVWLTYSEIGSLVKGKSEEEYQESVETLFDNLINNKINTVFYQCRAFCDSLYSSDIFPVSKHINSENGNLPFDPFEIFLKIGNEKGVRVHCWLNPYRVSYDSEFKNLPKNSPVRELYKENKTALIICDKGIFLNPATNEARELVLNGIREILNRYKVAGIHFDDYFYPETEKLNDNKLYKSYKNQGGCLALDDWRRENVNSLVSSVYSLVKYFDEALIFSISPSADIEKCKNIFYADVEKWCMEDGFVDLIIPQIYYGFENETMPFKAVAEEWEQLAEGGGTKLVCGLATYKCGREDEFAGSGKNEWNENVNILSRQYEQVLKNQVWQGFSLFSYSYCFGDNVTQNSKKEIKNLLCMVE